MLVATNNHADWPKRVEILLQLMEAEAGIRASRTGPWARGGTSPNDAARPAKR